MSAEKEEGEHLSFKMKLFLFLDSTTFHGLRYVSDRQGRMIRRLTWLLLFCIAVGGLLYLVIGQILLFMTYPKSVNIDVISPEKMLFPAVTLCNQNTLRQSVAVQKGLYDSLTRDFQKLKLPKGLRKTDNETGCEDTFLGYVNTNLTGGDRASDTVIHGVTLDVCQALCVQWPQGTCNSILYEADNKVCTLTKYLATSKAVQVVQQQGVDFLSRDRCETFPDVRCSFEAGLCDFQQDVGDDWQRQKESPYRENTGPREDHTSGQGFYLYLHVDQNRTASFSSPLISAPNRSRCVEFYYHMYGLDQGRLELYVRYGDGSRDLVWQRNGPQGNTWRRGFLNITSELFQLQFQGTGTKGLRDYMAIDDIRIADCTRFGSNCKRHKSGRDYTGTISRTKSGKRCRRWADVRQTPLNRLYFPDESLEQSLNYCRNPGILENASEPWCFYGSGLDDWETCDVPFCSCSADEFACQNEKCVPRERLCDGGDDCGDSSDESDQTCTKSPSCNFESPFICGYTLDQKEDYAWEFNNGSTASYGTGPITDDTNRLADGGYVYVDSTAGYEGNLARLTSPTTTITSGCLSFRYHMFGDHIGSLHVLVAAPVTGQTYQLWQVSTGGGDVWQQQNVTLEHAGWDLGDRFSFVFEARRGNGTRGDIALDRVVFAPGTCPEHTQGCESGDFQCDNGRCIPRRNLCDEKDDCHDNTDEDEKCASLTCNFRRNFTCGFKMSSPSWVVKVRPNSEVTVQDGDEVTTMKDEAYISSSSAGVSSLYSGWMAVYNDSCLTYLRRAAGNLAGVLKVYVERRGENGTAQSTLVHVYVRDRTDHWVKERLQLEGQPGQVRLRFDAVSSYVGSSVLLDNINVEEGICDDSHKTASCTFDDPRLCGYRVDLFGDYTWSRIQDKEYGQVMATDRQAQSGANTTYLSSPTTEMLEISCLKFSYRMSGIDPGEFAVYRYSDDYYGRLWRVLGDQGPEWRQVELEVASGNISFVFMAVRGYEDSSNIMVDNITATPGICPSVRCEIGQPMCDNGVCVNSSQRCDGVDDCGGSMYDEVSTCDTSCTLDVRGELYTGRVNVTVGGETCLPWSQALGPDPLLTFPDVSSSHLLNHCRNPRGLLPRPWCYTTADGQWDYCDIPMCRPCDPAKQFTCGNGNCVALSLTCDGKDDCGDKSDEQSPQCPASLACDFEDDYLCGYEVDGGEWPFVWRRGHVPGTDLAPVNSTGTSLYTTSKTAQIGWRARVRSPPVTLPARSCLHFRFLLSRSVTKNLRVYMEYDQGVLSRVDTVRYQSGAVWFSRYYTVPPGTYRVMFEAELTDHREVTAIDDVQLYPRECTSQEASLHTCFHQPSGLTYTGHLNTTSKGPCLRWDSGLVDEVVQRDRFFLDGSVAEAGDSCRNPGRKVQPYCYVANRTIALCDVGQPYQLECDIQDACDPTVNFQCSNGRCVRREEQCDGVEHCGDGSDETDCSDSCLLSRQGQFYSGQVAVTRSGRPCASWADVYGNPGVISEFLLPENSLADASSYCRNPNNSVQGPWCYTNANEGIQSEFCSIPMCQGLAGCDPKFEFRCRDGECIPQEKTCDGHSDCRESEDEVEPCARSRFDIAKEQCRYTIKGTEYRGPMNTTRSGKACKPWEEYGLDGNYCRNPGGSRDQPWCKVDGTPDWEYCDVPVCECFMGTFDYEYIGSVNVTETGLSCLDWDQVVARVVDHLPDGSQPELAGNSCRNPEWNQPYCYTPLPDLSWEHCRIEICEGAPEARGVSCTFDYDYKCGYTTNSFQDKRTIHPLSTNAWVRKGSHVTKDSADYLRVLQSRTDVCAHNSTLGHDYRGKVSTTKNGYTCQRWDAQYPHMFDDRFTDGHFSEGNRSLAENYCRNPRFRQETMWCFTTNPDVEIDFCDVPKCQDSIMVAVPGDVPGEAELYSPYFDHVNVSCLQFKYYLPKSRDPATLTVISEDESGTRRLVWNRVAEGSGWEEETVELRHLEGRQRVVFVSKQGAYDSATALDDVNYIDGPCPDLKECTEDEFRCTNGRCVPETSTCNEYDDCSDNSDEINCTCSGYRCPDGRCIANDLRWDGQNDCLDGSDETDQESITLPDNEDREDSTQRQVGIGRKSDYDKYPRIDLDGATMLNFFKQAAPVKDTFIHSCTWSNEDCLDSVNQTVTDFGICYTFNMDNSREVKLRGANNGLKLMLNIECYETMEGLNNAKGVKAYLHEPGTLPPISELGFALAPGLSYLISVEVSNVTRLGPRWGKCGQRALRYYRPYDRASCQLECATNQSLAACNCIAPHMEQDQGRNEICGFQSYTTCYLTENNTAEEACECPEQCNEVVYTSDISFSRLAPSAQYQILTGHTERLRRQLRQAVQYSDLKDQQAYVNDLRLFRSIADIHDEALAVVEAFNDTNVKEVNSDVQRWERALRRFFEIYEEDYNTTKRLVGEGIRRRIRDEGKVNKQIALFVEQFEYMFLRLGLVLGDGPRDSMQNDSVILTIETEIMEQLSLFSVFISEHAGPTDAFKNCTSANSSYISFINETNLIRNELGNGRYLGSLMKRRLQAFEDHLVKTVIPCLSRPQEILSNVLLTLDELAPQNTVWNRYRDVQDLRIRLRVRELRIALIQNQRAYGLIFNQFLMGTHKSNTTKKVVDEIVPNMETEMMVILQQIKSEYLDSLVSMVEETFDDLIVKYKTMLRVRLMLQPYFPKTTLDSIIENMKIWERNLLSIVSSVVLTASLQDKATINEYPALPQDRLEGLVEEHVEVYREPILISLAAYRRNLANVESRLSILVGNATRLADEQQKKVSLDEDFIRDNFLSVDIFFAQLTVRTLIDQPALNEIALIGVIGGNMGLLIGGSLLSIMEIVDLFLVYLGSWFWVKKHRHVEEATPDPDAEEGWPQKNGDAGDGVEANDVKQP